MNKNRISTITLIALFLGTATSFSEWYQVQSVSAYNTIKATKADGKSEPLIIRIRNLEKIEYIQPKSEKVLLGGTEALSLTKSILTNQTVWIENLKAEQGAYSADVYPSFEQVVKIYKRKRILNGDNISGSMKKNLMVIYKQMLMDLNQTPLLPSTDAQSQVIIKDIQRRLTSIWSTTLSSIKSDNPKVMSDNDGKGAKPNQYAGKFQRALFTSEAIVWYKEKGQKMHPLAQKLFVEMLQKFQSEADSDARYTQIKLREIMKRSSFFKEQFVNSATFERGKFTYTCLKWFKTTGQFVPESVQTVFITWLRIYQQSYTNEGDFMKNRLKWMMENDSLYFDFLTL